MDWWIYLIPVNSLDSSEFILFQGIHLISSELTWLQWIHWTIHWFWALVEKKKKDKEEENLQFLDLRLESRR